MLLGITLGTVLNVRGLGPFHSTTLLSTALVVGFVYIPYVARPIRAQVLALREREFVDAARQQGLSNLRIMFGEILPNLASTIIVFVPLILANAILLEAALDLPRRRRAAAQRVLGNDDPGRACRRSPARSTPSWCRASCWC